MANSFCFFTTNEIKPRGWLKRQLILQAEGLNGNLDKIWPDVRDSMWIGGDREGWERVPYWLDGFIPLAYLLDDEDMKNRAKRYIDKILEFQRPDGWICPNGETPIEKYDNWAVLLISKTLTVYYECSKDSRIPNAIYGIMKNYYELLRSEKIRLFKWGEHRWFEGFIALNRLAEWYPEENWIWELAKLLKEQGTDYEALTDKWKTPMNIWTQDTHIVNLVMMLKSEAVSCELLGESYGDLAERLYRVLKEYNGTAVETFTGDECLAGVSPIQGTELCSVVELMFSYELLYAYTGDPKWAERLEKIAFNALPATISDDMWSHQYVQMVNQIDCTPINGNMHFSTNGGDAHTFGLEPFFGCCTANFGQGWPKLALFSFLKDSEGVINSLAIPSELHTVWKDASVRITLDTNYPFRNSFVYKIEADRRTDMKLKIRIPSFAENVRVNGELMESGSIAVINGFEKGITEITLTYDTQPRFVSRPHGFFTVEYGSLVFSLPVESETQTVEYEKNGVERKFPYCDYHVKGTGDWGYAFADGNITAEEREMDDIPFSSKSPALVLKVDMCPIDWGYEERYATVCAKAPKSREPLDAPTEKTLYPYGCAKLRMTEMPKI